MNAFVAANRNKENQARPSVVPDLVVVGELNIDILLSEMNGGPAFGKERTAAEMTLALGSSSAILAANASALGVSAGFVGRVGVDHFGTFVTDRLQERGVDVQHVIATDDLATGLTVVFSHNGASGMMTHPGAMHALTINDVPWHYISGARHLHLSSLYLQPGLRPDAATLFERARQAGLTASLDTNWDPEEEWASDVLHILPHANIFFPNREEAMHISGQSSVSAALDFFEECVETVVVTCGADGVVARHEGRSYSCPAVQTSVVDTVGAGDSFAAGFLSRYIAGFDIPDCLLYGTVAAAFSTTAPGGTAAFSDHQAFERFAEEHLEALSASGS